ncbi:MAG: cell division protein FtsA [Ottowia sp.]|nr:cell division protein FtsA [Ottowia sp.]
MAKEYKDLIVALDIGSAKVMALVGEVLPNGELKLAGLGMSASDGIKRGVVVNIDATVASIHHALKEAELMADCKIGRVRIGISGDHIRGINSTGVAAIRDRDEVSMEDVRRVESTAEAVSIPGDRVRLLSAPQGYTIDQHNYVRERPIGMSGTRLEAMVHIITGAKSAVDNIVKCVRRCGLDVEREIIPNALASSTAVLSADERELGVACVDIGAGTTDVTVFLGSALRHTVVIPIAGDLMTRDIAMALRTSIQAAEDLKTAHGCAKAQLAGLNTNVEVLTQDGGEPKLLSRQALAGVLEPRVEEIFRIVQSELRENGFEELLSSGIVLTGGAAVMPGMQELAEDIFLKPVRRGVPRYTGYLAEMVSQPFAATAMGLMEDARQERLCGRAPPPRAAKMGAFWSRVRDFVVGNF